MTHRRVAALAAFLMLALTLPALVLAHSDLVQSDPADGATLTTTPYTLTATFSQDIDLDASTLVVKNASGVEVAHGTVNPDDNKMMTAELPVLSDGVYTVRWTTVTPDDSGIENGTYTFRVAATNASATPAPSSGPIFPPPSESGSNDLLIALVLAAIGIAAVVLFVFFRGRR
ncbi:MAG: copper resistance CopC family protein [Chloroflexota bacterium]